MDRFDTSRDPRFKRAPRNLRRVNVDQRFAHMFNDKRFVETSSVDARGQKLRRNTARLKLQDFYELAHAGQDNKVSDTHNKTNHENILEAHDDSKQEDDETEEISEADDVDEEEDELEETLDEDSTAWQRQQADLPSGDATRRLAVLGCDWDHHISAADIMVMFHTYLNSKEARKGSQAIRSGLVQKVAIYPSDYGLEQLKREAEDGPLFLSSKAKKSVRSDNVLDEESIQQESLRLYQLERTKYYWALVELDSADTASWLYDQMDGLEADGICPGTLDLRFVPEDLSLPHKPTSQVTELPKKFQGPAMLRSATGHTKVQCTWDETPLQRRKDLMRKKFTPKELEDMDMKAYLATSSEDEDAAVETVQTLRALVADSALGEMAEADGGTSSEEISTKRAVRDNNPKASNSAGAMEATFSIRATELEEQLSDRVQKKGTTVHMLDAPSQSAWDKYLEKRKQKRSERKQKAREEKAKLRDEDSARFTNKLTKSHRNLNKSDLQGSDLADLELLATSSSAVTQFVDGRGFNLRGPQRRAHSKGLAADEASDAFNVNVDDPRISQVFSSADFEIDPTHPEFRKSDGMQEVLKKKRHYKASKKHRPA